MVTTRSADKRLDASKGEDLVLRSRTIGSPSSVASTLSHSQKRTANSRENNDGLRSKRVRIETNGNASSKTSHVVVNVPVISINRENPPASDGVIKSSGSMVGVETILNDDLEIDQDRDQVTPNAKVTTVAETPDQGGETFRTPATSRYKRFDSEEPNDDTIVVSTVIDSSAPQGYHTAEEEIADDDDDDDDEAPDVESTKAAPKLPQRRSLRTAKGRKQPPGTPSTTDAGDKTLEVRPNQFKIESESFIVDEESPASELGNDQVSKAEEPGQETLDANSVPSALEPLPPQKMINSHPLTPLSGGVNSMSTRQNQSLSSPKNQETGSAEDADVESVTVSDSTLQDLSLSEGKTASQIENIPNEISDSTHKSFFPHIPGRSTQIQVRNSDLAPIPNAVRLPAKATSGLSDYRRRNFQQKVVASAGGFKMQTDWPKKRSSFVVS